MRLSIVVTLIWIITAAGLAAETRKPNIVFILADDLGYTDLACYGSKYYETPHIDQLAREGMRFTNGYSCGPNCQPSRAALMSGQYGPRTGVYTVGSINRFDWHSRPLRPVENVTELPLDKITIADTLKKSGYVTGMFGKWHLGNDSAHFPSKRGFDEAIESSGAHFDFETSPKTNYPPGQYLADFLTDHAVDFIERHKDRPFFLYLPHFGVHSPHDAKPALTEHFNGKQPVGGHKSPVYAAMIASVDESVGRVVETLDRLGLTENTLVIFSSDNGGVGGYENAGLSHGGITDNAPLKGGKGMLYEGGIRVPFIFCWKGKFAPGTANDTPILGVDLYPTLVEVARATAPADYPLDGVSCVSMLMQDKQPSETRELFWHFPGYLGFAENEWRTTPAASIRAGDWKLIEFFEDRHKELYNLKNDIGERHDLAAEYPEKAAELYAKMMAWRERIGATIPTKNTAQTDRQQPTKKERQKNRQAQQSARADG